MQRCQQIIIRLRRKSESTNNKLRPSVRPPTFPASGEHRSRTSPHLKSAPSGHSPLIEKGKQLHLISRLLSRPTSTRFSRKHAGFRSPPPTHTHPSFLLSFLSGPRYAKRAASRRVARRLRAETPDADMFYINRPPPLLSSPPSKRASVHLYCYNVENHLHGISGRQRTASYSFCLIPDTDKRGMRRGGCACSSVNFRDTCRSPGYFWVASEPLGVC